MRARGVNSVHAKSLSALRPTLLLAAAVLLLGGCSASSRENKPRPPAEILVTVAIKNDNVTVSPSTVGAGPATFKVSNQSGRSLRFVVRGTGFERSTDGFNPDDTVDLKINLKPGDYQLAAGDSTSIQPMAFRVTKERPSSQDDLLLP